MKMDMYEPSGNDCGIVTYSILFLQSFLPSLNNTGLTCLNLRSEQLITDGYIGTNSLWIRFACRKYITKNILLY